MNWGPASIVGLTILVTALGVGTEMVANGIINDGPPDAQPSAAHAYGPPSTLTVASVAAVPPLHREHAGRKHDAARSRDKTTTAAPPPQTSSTPAPTPQTQPPTQTQSVPTTTVRPSQTGTVKKSQ